MHSATFGHNGVAMHIYNRYIHFTVLKACFNTRPGCISLLLIVLLEKLLDSVNRVEKLAYGSIMVERVDDECDVLAHIYIDIIWLGAFNSFATSSMLSPEEIISSMINTSLPSTELPRNSCATIGLRPFTILV